MTTYPNLLTPPMDPSDLLFSPKSENNQSPPMGLMAYTNMYANLHPKSHEYGNLKLEIVEQPVEKFRFRYKSEMAGTHGSLNGRNSDRSRKQTHPCVRLLNYNEPALIRCSLYQIAHKEPHAHRLVRRIGPDEIDDPHNIEVGPDYGFTANFANMGIIHTAKKFIVPELMRKYTVLKKEAIVRQEGMERLLNGIEEIELKQKAESESNHINLNQVCLKFEAFKRDGIALLPLCSPVYSGMINNLKSALTGDLRIVRMDHCTSSTRGGREIFILVEKVTKKNIKIRFFELDDEDNEIWSDYGRFNDLDVHHQYAIVFKTPSYRTIDIDKQVKVYIELQRPSDGARSEPKDFMYTPCEVLQRRKRQRGSFSSYSNSSSISSRDFPATLPTMLSNSELCINNSELNEALANNNIDSAEFQKVCEQLMNNGSMNSLYTDSSIALDAPAAVRSMSYEKTSSPDAIIRRVETEIDHFLRSLKRSNNSPSARIRAMLDSLFEEHCKLPNGNNILHILILKNNCKEEFLVRLLNLIKTFGSPQLMNLQNAAGKTPLHCAIEMGYNQVMELLLEMNSDMSIQDMNGNTPLHSAITNGASKETVQSIFKYKNTLNYINIRNYEGYTALHVAVKLNKLGLTELLCDNSANINLASNKNGYTPLHMAVVEQNPDIVMYLLDTNCDCSLGDFIGSTAIKLANALIESDKPITSEIYKLLETHMKREGTFEEMCSKEESTSDMEVDVPKQESELTPDKLIVKYQRITHMPQNGASKVTDMMNASDRWKTLAKHMGYGYMIRNKSFEGDLNPAGSFLDFVLAHGQTSLLAIRNALESLDERSVIELLDSIVKEE